MDLVLPHEFYLDGDVVSIAKQLLGKLIISQVDGVKTSGLIVETEAYRGPDDKGSHAYGGRYTKRTQIMYETGGKAYVYICYGMHPMLNVVTGIGISQPHAVLIRSIEPIEGIEMMMQRRKMLKQSYQLTNGPAKLAIALGVTKEMNGCCFYENPSLLQIGQGISICEETHIVTGLRVGMSKHVGHCAYRPWRFYIKENKWVSKPLEVKYYF